MNALATIPLRDIQTMADAMATSGLFGMKSAAEALALMLVAQSEGQHPATIAQDYDIIQGKAARKTHSVLARFQAAGGRVEWHELTENRADATFSHPSGGSLRIDWTFDQAKKAGLTGKDNWKNFPRAMLRARCIAEGVRAVYPAALGGMMIAEEAADLQPAPPAEKFMGQAEVVSPPISAPTQAAYPQDRFDANLPEWRTVIESGRKTPEQLIVMLSTKAALSDEQKAQIMALGQPATEGAE